MRLEGKRQEIRDGKSEMSSWVLEDFAKAKYKNIVAFKTLLQYKAVIQL